MGLPMDQDRRLLQYDLCSDYIRYMYDHMGGFTRVERHNLSKRAHALWMMLMYDQTEKMTYNISIDDVHYQTEKKPVSYEILNFIRNAIKASHPRKDAYRVVMKSAPDRIWNLKVLACGCINELKGFGGITFFSPFVINAKNRRAFDYDGLSGRRDYRKSLCRLELRKKWQEPMMNLYAQKVLPHRDSAVLG